VSADGDRWIEAADFFQGMFTTALAPEEILTEVVIPGKKVGSGYAFEEFARRRGDYALMGVAALLHLDAKGHCSEVRLVFLNAGEGPVLAGEAADMLMGQAPTEENVTAAARHAAESEIQPLGNLHATPAFQRHLARVLARRAILKAIARARENGSSPS
jgi:carbon-monoxide dehydrogenase medium subunit